MIKKRKLSSKKKPRKKVIYKKARCSYLTGTGRRCKNNAVGKTDLCAQHGGNPIVEESLVAFQDLSALEQLKSGYDASVHPMQYLRLAADGKSIHEIASDMGIGSNTLKRWAETHEDFAFVFEMGQDMHKAHYLKLGKRNVGNPLFQTPLFKFLAMNAVGFTDKIESNNLNLNANVGVLVAPAPMSVDEWEEANVNDDADRKKAADEKAQDAEFTEVED